MTRRERDQIRAACYLLMEEAGDGFHTAMAILCPLAGLTLPACTVDCKPISIRELLSQKETR